MGKEEYKVNKEIKYDDSMFKINELITSKLNTIIYLDTDIELLKDTENNSENFWEKYTLKFFIQDDKGLPLSMIGGSGRGKNVNDERVKGNY